MSGLYIPPAYLKKCLLFVSLFGFIVIGSIGGCSDNNGSIKATALSENDFAEDSALRADLDKGVIVTFLEAPNSEKPEKDTGEVGVDEIPVTYDETTEQKFCWKDDIASAKHFMELTDNEGSLILTVQANGDCVTEVIEAGDYLLSIHHDGSVEVPLPIFLIPNPQQLEQTRETDGLIDRFKLAASNILKRVESAVTKDANAQRAIEEMDILLSTKNCDFCNLINADFRDAYLFDIHLEGADLRGADFTGATLEYANFTYSGLGTSRHVYAQLVDSHTGLTIGNIVTPVPVTLDGRSHNVSMELADIAYSDFSGADLTGVDFTGATAFNTDFTGAIMLDSIMLDMDLITADFSLATWCNGCICAQGSIGGCDGCPSVEKVCTGL